MSLVLGIKQSPETPKVRFLQCPTFVCHGNSSIANVAEILLKARPQGIILVFPKAIT
jgi:hypothetical protein